MDAAVSNWLGTLVSRWLSGSLGTCQQTLTEQSLGDLGGGDSEKRKKMAEKWKELVAGRADKALGLRLLFELTGVNLWKMRKDHNTEKLGLGEARGGKRGGGDLDLGFRPNRAANAPYTSVLETGL